MSKDFSLFIVIFVSLARPPLTTGIYVIIFRVLGTGFVVLVFATLAHRAVGACTQILEQYCALRTLGSANSGPTGGVNFLLRCGTSLYPISSLIARSSHSSGIIVLVLVFGEPSDVFSYL